MQDRFPLPPRPRDAHKGTFGRVLGIGGSAGMSGAISLTGKACLRSGAGLVTLAVPGSIAHIVAAHDPCYMTLGQPENVDGVLEPSESLAQRMAAADVVALGPGLGQSDQLADWIAQAWHQCPRPMVVDADALNALSKLQPLPPAAAARICTPHPGEFARLTGNQSPDQELAVSWAKQVGCVLVLKGHRTVITDGDQVHLNTTGNPGMATGGSGDVLTGIIAALVAQGLSPFDAARWGVYVHGQAGDLAAAEVGEISLVATDLLRFLPAAFQAAIS